MAQRRVSTPLRIGKVTIGGDAPITVQSMTKTDTHDIPATVNQIKQLENCGCEIVRVAIPDKEAAESISAIKKHISLPLIADIHFDYRLALTALQAGSDGLRLNPGNIGDREQIAQVVAAAKEREVPIRIGVNAGSLPPNFEPDAPLAKRMVDMALEQIRLMENLDFNLIKVSLKAFDVPTTIQAYQMIADEIPYPLHLGITEAGLPRTGVIRSAIGIGILLYQGIGDTIRVSLSAHPCEEVFAAYEILKSLGLRQRGPTLVSCPSCGRAEVDVIALAEAVNKQLEKVTKPIKVAVMGCMPPGSIVIANSIPKPIEEIKIGDEVLSHSGSFQVVIQCFARHYRGDLVRIQPRGFPSFLVTPEHPIRVIPRPFLRKGKDKRIAVSRAVESGPLSSWVEAKSLPRGWIMTYPIIKGERDVKKLNFEGLLPIKVDRDFLVLSGYYVAEGSLDSRGGKPYAQKFNFHIKEMPYYLILTGILNKYGINTSLYSRPYRKTVEVCSNSLAFGLMLEKLFGKGAGNKRLPHWMITLPRKKQAYLIKALWEGDGYIGKVRGYWRAQFVTISLSLAFQVQQLLLRQGIIASLSRRPSAEGHQESWGVTVTNKESFERLAKVLGLDFHLDTSPQPQHMAIDRDFLYTPIFKIDRIPYKGEVYNLEVANDHSYSTLGAATHNCIVNGPGEAKDADVGIACGKGKGAIFRKGKVVKTVTEENFLDALMAEIVRIA